MTNHRHILWETKVTIIEKTLFNRETTPLPETNLWMRVYDGVHWLSEPIAQRITSFTPAIQFAGFDRNRKLLVVDIWDVDQEKFATFTPEGDRLYFTGHSNDPSFLEYMQKSMPSKMITTIVSLDGIEHRVYGISAEQLRDEAVSLMQSATGKEAHCMELGLFKSKHGSNISFNFKYKSNEAHDRDYLSIRDIDAIECKLQELYATARGTINHMNGNFKEDYQRYQERRDRLLVALKDLLNQSSQY
ncbi:hypothetical protein PVA45_05630 [Entomospira entomophila]|uniref:Uncharacterized protein n=1 Tax=Entomospira entomophila TaxID=2719988 RepID=A0A968KRQ0_9SPIO|nr:hypothetical protein [Entomospira entomophilus]NIZ40978.1 hypothetical protein [Entomospira entomophilus]WDI35191.1 hypothetical protein PVA45_05630 [Entomospira entomophilus]